MVIPGDNDTSIVIIDQNNYVKKMQKLIDKEIKGGVYASTLKHTLQDLKRFQDFFKFYH